MAAYEREQQAIAAPTTLRDGFGSPGSGNTSSSNRGDAAQIAGMVQALTRQNTDSATMPEAVRALTGQRQQSSAESGDADDQNAAFLAKARSRQIDDYLKSTRTAPSRHTRSRRVGTFQLCWNRRSIQIFRAN
jgi:hypothetical protein